MTHFLLFAILLAICIGLPRAGRVLGVLVLLALLWAASLDGHKPTDTKVTDTRSTETILPTPAPTIAPTPAPVPISPTPAPDSKPHHYIQR